MEGRITASVAGNYTVDCGGEIIVCKAKGLFRLKKISPYVGDYVTLEQEGGDYVIARIEQRRNALVRPPLANLDCGIIVVSSCEPRPNALVIDRLTVIFESKGIEPVFVFTKVDLKSAALLDVYKTAGFECFLNGGAEPALPSPTSSGGLERLEEYLRGKTSALIGNTGVGKTTLLNRLLPGLDAPTAGISKKLGRGKHTTRTVELRALPSGGFIADTPGFSTVETKLYGEIPASQVALHFREFAGFIGQCKFGGCTHNGEDGCAFPNDGSRYESYKAIFAEAKRTEESW
jgi:ribosome biogenesis GTPase